MGVWSESHWDLSASDIILVSWGVVMPHKQVSHTPGSQWGLWKQRLSLRLLTEASKKSYFATQESLQILLLAAHERGRHWSQKKHLPCFWILPWLLGSLSLLYSFVLASLPLFCLGLRLVLALLSSQQSALTEGSLSSGYFAANVSLSFFVFSLFI